MASQIKSQIFSGVKWNAIGQFVRQSFSFVVSVILARLLTPEEFGLIAMLFVFSEIATAFINSGLSAALIQRRVITDIDCSTIFYFSIGAALLLYVLFYSAAPYIAQFYNEPQLMIIIKIYGLAFVIQSFSLVHTTLFVKQLNYKLTNTIQTVGAISAGIVVVFLAYVGAGVYSLVGQSLTLAIATTVLSFILSTWRPTLAFSWVSFKKMYGYGVRVFAVMLLDKIFNAIDNLILGKVFSADLLGLYNRGKATKDLAVRNVTNITTSFVFPVFSKVEGESELKSIHNKYIGLISYITWPMMVGMFIVAEPLIYVVYSNKWAAAVPYLQMFCVFGITYPLNSIMVQTIMSLGRSDSYLRLELIKKSIILSSMLLGVYYDISVFLGALCISHYIALLLTIQYVSHQINVSIISIVKEIIPGFVIASTMGITLHLIKSNVSWPNDWIQLCTLTFIGFVGYIGISVIFKRQEYIYLQNLVLKKLNRV